MNSKIKELVAHRMNVSLLLAMVMLGLAFFAMQDNLPAFIQTAVYKGFLVLFAAFLGYWVDRGLFPYARPDSFQTIELLDDDVAMIDHEGQDITLQSIGWDAHVLFAAAMIRRAIVVAAVMLCVGLGV